MVYLTREETEYHFWRSILKKSVVIIDVLALLGFLFAFAPDLTGYAIHEWLGLAVGIVLLIHLLQHWKWVFTVSQRIGRTKQKVLVRFFVDGMLFFFFFTIIVTGIIISLILNLPLENYKVWRLIHVSSSYGTLAMIGFKIALHWDWILKQIKKVDKTSQSDDVAKVSRRNFLRTGLITSAAVVIAIAEFKEWQNKTSGYFPVGETSPQGDGNSELIKQVNEIPNEPTEDAQQRSGTATSTAEGNSDEVIAAASQNTATPIPTIIPTATPTEAAATGVVRCNRGCTYPGKCGRYQDDDQNGKCDLGEPIW